MSETFDSINEWQRNTFPTATVRGVIKHYFDEIVEFDDALEEEDQLGQMKDEGGSLEEAVDIILLLCDYLQRAGNGAQYHIDKKMEKCRGRRWKILPDGTGRHE